MKLRDMSADQILEVLESRSDELREAEEKTAGLEGAFKAFEASSELAWRDSGKSMAEAEKRVRGSEDWLQHYLELQSAHVEAAEKKRAYKRAEDALRLWQTEQSTLRAIR